MDKRNGWSIHRSADYPFHCCCFYLSLHQEHKPASQLRESNQMGIVYKAYGTSSGHEVLWLGACLVSCGERLLVTVVMTIKQWSSCSVAQSLRSPTPSCQILSLAAVVSALATLGELFWYQLRLITASRLNSTSQKHLQALDCKSYHNAHFPVWKALG